MLCVLLLAAALVPQAPSPGAAGRTSAVASSPPLVPRAVAFALAAVPFAAIAEMFEDAAAPGDIGIRPTIGGVNLFVFYAVYQVCFQAYLRLRPGGADVALINGTKMVNGKPLGASPFARTFDETVEAASEAARRLREGKPGER